MLEFKPLDIELAKQFSKLKNIPEVHSNGYDKTPNPFTEKDAIELLEKEIGKTLAQRFFIYWNNELAGEIGIKLKDDVFRLNAEIGYFIGKEFWGIEDEFGRVGSEKGERRRKVNKQKGIVNNL